MGGRQPGSSGSSTNDPILRCETYGRRCNPDGRRVPKSPQTSHRKPLVPCGDSDPLETNNPSPKAGAKSTKSARNATCESAMAGPLVPLNLSLVRLLLRLLLEIGGDTGTIVPSGLFSITSRLMIKGMGPCRSVTGNWVRDGELGPCRSIARLLLRFWAKSLSAFYEHLHQPPPTPIRSSFH